MRPEEWKRIKNFSPEEKWGDPDQMDLGHMLMLDSLRKLAGKAVIVHGAFATSGHSDGSYHYIGLATDLHIKGANLLDQYLLAEEIGFNGLGVYPHWNIPGLHCDSRPDPLRSRWWRRKDGKYVPLTSVAFRKWARTVGG